MEILTGLNSKQREAVTHGEGPLLVLAGVGTGKTTIITRRVAFLISEGFVQRPNQLLVFTFTERAAEEMLDRAFEWVGYAALDAWVSTYHSVCQRILQENAPLAGLPHDFKVLDEWDQKIFLLDHFWRLPLRKLKPRATRNPLRFLQPIIFLIQRAKDEGLSPEDYLAWVERKRGRGELPDDLISLHEELARVYATYQGLLEREGYVDFGDLILKAVKLLEGNPSLLHEYHRRFPYVLADEFQDTSPAEFRLVELLGGHRNITVVGDDDQAIYGFRGVRWDNLRNFLTRFPEARLVVLEENYRSTQEILDRARRLIRHNSFRLEALAERGEIPYGVTKVLQASGPKKSGPEPVHFHFTNVLDEAEFLAEKIVELRREESIPYGEFAVLYRNRYRPDPYLRALSEREIPWLLAGRHGTGLFDQEEIKVLISFLRCLADPKDDQSLFHLLGSELYEMPGEDISVLLGLSQRWNRPMREMLEEAAAGKVLLSPEGRDVAARVREHLRACGELAKDRPTGQVLYAYLSEHTGYIERLSRSQDLRDGRKLEHIADFFEQVVRRFEEISRHDRVPWFVRYVEELRAMGYNPLVGEAEPGVEAVQVLTFHQAKGLEFRVVFLTGLIEDFFPGRPRSSALALPPGLVPDEVPREIAHLEEQRRLFYVGMTRAKEYLFLLSSEDYRLPGEEPRKRPAKVSRFVVEALGPENVAQIREELPPLVRISRTGRHPVRAEPEVREGAPLILSHRQIDDYLTCPLKYRYIHILRVPIVLHPSVVLGHAVHRAIQAYHLAKLQGRAISLDDLLLVFRNSWQTEGFLSARHEEEMLKHGEKCLRRFFAFEEGRAERPAMVEQFFAFPAGNVRVIGYWDRVDRNEDGAVIIDYKTSQAELKDAPRKARDSLQLAIYALAYERLVGERPKGIELRFLTPEVVIGRASPTDKMLSRALRAIMEAEAGIRARIFDPKPNVHACRPCAYRDICPHAKPL
jgi:DNA helicase-2/ATP-dependent DNA helicase PcrA